ncbi:SAM-dependent methyltransferase [Bailinhaonella thermotolerans]|uniref:SAM-dependent methyltransferase n=1 Tax=Bailinhaonella thermotolerans TaxID=1070861 RepID=A0A3A4AA27_9ACTN|nr:SAM-dependent methyltransferase [Bailinhaonella thermotolerans]RJL23204.1 hypothetical protein D5H75_33035 [Bailinhaonella thermotolerans]
MTSETTPDFSPTTASAARMYDYYLDGKDNWAADRDAAEKVAAVFPDIGVLARANRGFLLRTVRHLAEVEGLTQFIDVGAGIPTDPRPDVTAREVRSQVS